MEINHMEILKLISADDDILSRYSQLHSFLEESIDYN